VVKSLLGSGRFWILLAQIRRQQLRHDEPCPSAHGWIQPRTHCEWWNKASAKQLSIQPKKKEPIAVELGRLGGLRGGAARAAKMTLEERTASAVKAANGRWNKSKTAAK